tara:strand:+ start:144 stop:602 length:459 start_codon:yes stop_codon:yes gene_type:complete
MKNIEVSKEELMAVPYKNLLEKFTELNVKDAWKPGTKREKMVDNALEKIKILKKLEAKELSPEEMEALAKEMIEKNRMEEALQAEKEKEAKILAEDNSKQGVRNRIEAMNLSKEQVIKSIKGINTNLINGIPSQRKILLVKLEILEDILNNQ